MTHFGFIWRLLLPALEQDLAQTAPAYLAGFLAVVCPTVGLTGQKSVPFAPKQGFYLWNEACCGKGEVLALEFTVQRG